VIQGATNRPLVLHAALRCKGSFFHYCKFVILLSISTGASIGKLYLCVFPYSASRASLLVLLAVPYTFLLDPRHAIERGDYGDREIGPGHAARLCIAVNWQRGIGALQGAWPFDTDNAINGNVSCVDWREWRAELGVGLGF
jgi:hypothetical protein